MTRNNFSAVVTALFLITVSLNGAAIAQAYPVKPVRLIVPFPPGGGFDAIGRPYAERLGTALGQNIIVDNRPGASGNIGAMAVAKSAPDGYTLLLGNDFMPLNVVLSANPGYDAVADFAPISLVGTVPNVLVINPVLPARDLKQLMVASRNKPLNFGSAAPGSVGHLLGELLNLADIVKMVHIPYKGSVPAVTDTVGGTLDAVITTLPSVSAFVRAGKLRAIGTFSARRSPAMPDMPTIAEAGGPSTTGEVWYGVFAPTATSEAVIRRVNEATVMVLKQPELIEALRKAGFEPTSSTPAGLSAQIKGDIEKWGRLAKAANVKKEGADNGLQGYMAIYAAAKTPPAVVEKLNAEFNKAIRNPKVASMLEQQHFDPADGLTRTMGQNLNESMGQAVMVDLQPAAGGAIGAEQVARSTPDGYTLFVTYPDPMVLRHLLVKNVLGKIRAE